MQSINKASNLGNNAHASKRLLLADGKRTPTMKREEPNTNSQSLFPTIELSRPFKMQFSTELLSPAPARYQ